VFNYDRCLEYFLENALQLFYDITRDEAHTVIDTIQIFHPYGLVADLPRMQNGVVRGMPFGAASANYVALSQNIKIYTEQHAASDVLKIIAEALLWADQIAFLGFGYHEQNLDLLTPAAAIPSKPVYGTGKDWS
jgi:hypothetical protein